MYGKKKSVVISNVIVDLRAIPKELPQCLEILKYLSDLEHTNFTKNKTNKKPPATLTYLKLPTFLDVALIILRSLVRI